MQNISNFMIGKSSLQEITSLAIIRKISDSKQMLGPQENPEQFDLCKYHKLNYM